VDAVIVGAHWGTQFQDQYAARTVELAHQILDAGAAAIYGNHPHVMQGAEHYRTRDGRDTYVAYSIGSITSGLGSNPKWWKSRTSVVLFVEFEKYRPNRKSKRRTAQVVAVRYVPICEVRYTKERLRTMLPTSHALGKCSREEAWAKVLLGEKDFATPEQLPLVRRGQIEIIKEDEGWKGGRVGPAVAVETAVDDSDDDEKDEEASVTREAQRWRAGTKKP